MPTHRIVQADNLPAPAGPYSPATVFERLVFVAGQGARVALQPRIVKGLWIAELLEVRGLVCGAEPHGGQAEGGKCGDHPGDVAASHACCSSPRALWWTACQADRRWPSERRGRRG